MTSHIGRLYVIAGAMLVLFLGWAAVAAHPWDTTPVDPRVAALDARRAQVRHDAAEAKRVVALRWKRYEARLAVRRRAVDRAWKRRKREEADYQRRLAIARANRPVIFRTVYVASGGPAGSGGSAAPSGSGGGYSPPASSGGSPVASAPVSAPAAAAPPVVSIGSAAPVTSSGSS